MRVHRALAQAGVASRRGAEMLIEEERVYVNGKRAVIGQIVMPTDRIEVDGKLVTAEPIQTYMLNKPIGMGDFLIIVVSHYSDFASFSEASYVWYSPFKLIFVQY